MDSKDVMLSFEWLLPAYMIIHEGGHLLVLWMIHMPAVGRIERLGNKYMGRNHHMLLPITQPIFNRYH